MKLAQLHRAKPMVFSDETLWQRGYVIRRYRPGDEAQLDLREDFAVAWDAAGRELPLGLRWTLCATREWSDSPVAVGGLQVLAPRVFGAWGLSADLDARAWAFVRRTAAKAFAFAERELRAREIHATAPIERPGAIALLERLRFERRGLWKGPDEATYLHLVRSF